MCMMIIFKTTVLIRLMQIMNKAILIIKQFRTHDEPL
jgi:hypothetical protein